MHKTNLWQQKLNVLSMKSLWLAGPAEDIQPDMYLYLQSVLGADLFQGRIDNTEIPIKIAKAAGYTAE